MKSLGFDSNIENNSDVASLGFLDRLPILSFYANTKGWKFVLAWVHRIFGLILIFYLLFHIYILSFLPNPGLYTAKWATYDNLFFKFVEWILAIPLIFHTLNGARLILYESFGQRDDRQMIIWSFSIGFIYIFLLGFFIVIGNQREIPPLFFWLNILIVSLIFSYYLYRRIWDTPNSSLWKLNRLCGAFLFVMLPAHMLFMHINYPVGHQATAIADRMQHFPIMVIDAVLTITILYHAAFGIYSIIEDYIGNWLLRRSLAVLLFLLTIYFGYIGVKLAFFLT